MVMGAVRQGCIVSSSTSSRAKGPLRGGGPCATTTTGRGGVSRRRFPCGGAGGRPAAVASSAEDVFEGIHLVPSRASLLEREREGEGKSGVVAGKAGAGDATHVVSIETANLRGGELREAGAGVWLALFDGAGKCAVQHVVPRADLCFDRGTRETLAVRAEGLGDVERIWIGPGASTWLPEKVTVESLASSASASFKNAAILGERQDCSAAELRPFDAEAARRLAAESEVDYANLRKTLLLTDAALVLAGCAALALSPLGDQGAPSNFAGGGLIGFAYLAVLSSAVAAIGKPGESKSSLLFLLQVHSFTVAFASSIPYLKKPKGVFPLSLTHFFLSFLPLPPPFSLPCLRQSVDPFDSKGERSVLEKVVAVPATRFLFVLAGTYAVVQARQPTANVDVLPTIFETVAGLLMYKVSVLLVTALNSTAKEEEEQE